MASEKIKCKHCGKSFDPDLYSGLCPKCGRYSGRRMDSSALEHYISGGEQAEKEHRALHEKYDQGYDAAHPNQKKYDTGKDSYDYNQKMALLQEARESFEKRQKAAGKSAPAGGRYGSGGHSNAGGNASSYRQTKERETLINGKPVTKSPLPRFLLAIIITVFIAVLIVAISNVFWYVSLKQQAAAESTVLVAESAPGTVVFEHALLEGPITVCAESAGIVEDVEGLSGKSLYAVRVSGGSEAYNYDAKMSDVFVAYELEGDVFYEAPLSSYSLEEFCKKYNIWEDDVLSAYDLGQREYDGGWLIFLVDTEAEEFRLLLQLSRYEDPAVVLQEAYIDLEALPAVQFGMGDVEAFGNGG